MLIIKDRFNDTTCRCWLRCCCMVRLMQLCDNTRQDNVALYTWNVSLVVKKSMYDKQKGRKLWKSTKSLMFMCRTVNKRLHLRCRCFITTNLLLISSIASVSRLFTINDHAFLADRTNGRAIATMLRLSSVTLCIVAKRCVLEQKLLWRAYRKSYTRNRLVPKWMTLTFV